MITWDDFAINNMESGGIRQKFEDLCRQLFENEYLAENTENKYVHSNPNNAGLEADPVYQESSQKWIGFQAKFFDKNPNYYQIYHSAEKIIRYYSGKINVVYLYCNKDLKIESKGCQRTITLLQDHNITIQFITNNAILDQVRKHSYLISYYFGRHPDFYKWMQSHNNLMLSSLGERYNSEFNVETDCMWQLSLFVLDEDAAFYLNQKKARLEEKIDIYMGEGYQEFGYLEKLKSIIETIHDVDCFDLGKAFDWKEKIDIELSDEREKLENHENELEEQLNSLEFIDSPNKGEYYHISEEIDYLKALVEMPEMIAISDNERFLLQNKILAVTGDAGTGKSQLLANKTKSLLENNRNVLLLLASRYFSNESIEKQIMEDSGLDLTFDELIEDLEALGESKREIIPIFIDALNETWERRLWERDLPCIVDKIEKCNYVKLVFSYRTEYENYLLNDHLINRINDHSICKIIDEGFRQNSIQAIEQFLNFYGIPITPYEYFGTEMQNPLFLALYCKTYEGGEVSLSILYQRLIDNADKKIHNSMGNIIKQLGYPENKNFLRPLIKEVAEFFVDNEKRYITKDEFCKLNFWDQYRFPPQAFIQQAVNEYIFCDFINNEGEVYAFAYDQMNDYFPAEVIADNAESKDELRNIITNQILEIKNGEVKKFWNQDLFLNVCMFYRDKYGEECIDIIDDISDDSDKIDLFNSYINSLSWRGKESITREEILSLIRKYPMAYPENVWGLFIEDSVKIDHPLNANSLHKLLMSYNLNKRDYVWTIYINDCIMDSTCRVYQLIQKYNEGEGLPLDNDQQELLLILFGWFLTASNRKLRDETSKAMIEILKENFGLCEVILRKFENVNDPYVIQRLYGIVFGACCKREQEQIEVFTELAEYIYLTIFSKDTIYPDILLRDYARMIIERFLQEQPYYHGIIDQNKIAPPYRSKPIPEIKENYTNKKFDGGLLLIVNSIRFERMGGLYGDFGRYVFQSALRDFDVDEKIILNYAISYIINDLKYKNELFTSFDNFCERLSYNRHNTKKTERIGKKYEWITMYNILARVSDHCNFTNHYYLNSDDRMTFEGAWDLYVRDFDPTLNINFMVNRDAPIFTEIDTFIYKAEKENEQASFLKNDDRKFWLNEKGFFLSKLKDTNILTDDNSDKWIALYKYIETGKENRGKTGFQVWGYLYAVFVTTEQETILTECVNHGIDLCSSGLNNLPSSYVLFNREYPWSPACKSLDELSWSDPSNSYGSEEGLTDKHIGKVLFCSCELCNENEYDASINEPIVWYVPCPDIIKECHMRQKKYDGFFYDDNGKLAAFDTNITQGIGGPIIRKDLLDNFLKDRGFKLIWILNCEKDVYSSTSEMQEWSRWTAMYTYNGEEIGGQPYKLSINY